MNIHCQKCAAKVRSGQVAKVTTKQGRELEVCWGCEAEIEIGKLPFIDDSGVWWTGTGSRRRRLVVGLKGTTSK